MKDSTRIFVDDFLERVFGSHLAHYASKYYDPAKAREYYLRTRELKGSKRSTKELRGTGKKEAWQYTKQAITKDKTAELKQAASTHKASQDRLRKGIQERRQMFNKDLQAKMKDIAEGSTAERKQIADFRKAASEEISAQMEAAIAAVPKVPKGLPEARRIELSAERAAEIAQIRGEAKAERDGLNESVNASRASLKEETSQSRSEARFYGGVEKNVIKGDLKAGLEKNKGAYEAKKAGIKAKFEQVYDSEFEGIRKKA